jgi:hypothetical protein
MAKKKDPRSKAQLDEARKKSLVAKRGLTPIEKLADWRAGRKGHGKMRLAIEAKCFDCEGGGADPGWKEAIGNCGIVTCPLHSFRPYQGIKPRRSAHHGGGTIKDAEG